MTAIKNEGAAAAAAGGDCERPIAHAGCWVFLVNPPDPVGRALSVTSRPSWSL